LLILAIAITSTAGAVLIYSSINNKNATLASLIEVTYPVFVVFFAYIFYRQMHVTPSVFIGGLMILFGAGLIIYNHQ
jgi:drug/metabolite transporter (DMT)-like permease